MKKLLIFSILFLATIVFIPQVFAQSCGDVVTAGTVCPNLCPGTAVPGSSGYTCCGTVDPTTNECKSNYYNCGDIASGHDVFGASCVCDTGFQFMSHGDQCCGYAYSRNGAAQCSATPITTNACGSEFTDETQACPADCPMSSKIKSGEVLQTYCCGQFSGDSCIVSTRGTPAPTVPANQIVNPQFLSSIDPLNFTTNFLTFQTPAGFLNVLLSMILFPLAGLILFVMIVWGGFEMLYNANDTKAQEAGKQRITAAFIGFILLFISYWIAQVIQTIFGINSLG